MSNVRILKFPQKSHRKQVMLPRFSEQLAEFFGIMLGDGGINNAWQANITLNSIKDADFAEYIRKLCKDLFNVEPAIRKRKTRNTLVISLASTTIVDFLVSNGLPRGSKLKHGLRIPGWILRKSTYKKACVRGLMDTDGCAFIHRHKVRGKIYHNIGLTFTSYDHGFIFEIADIFAEFGIIPHITKRGRDICFYQADAIADYFKIFGTSNNRISSVYKKWKDAKIA